MVNSFTVLLAFERRHVIEITSFQLVGTDNLKWNNRRQCMDTAAAKGDDCKFRIVVL